MNELRWIRAGAIGGILYAVIAFIAGFFVHSGPFSTEGAVSVALLRVQHLPDPLTQTW